MTTDPDSRFPRPSVVALFLTLILGLVVQAHGSLAYTKPHGRAGRVLFFFWRLNPIACLLETCLILWAFSVHGIFSSTPASSGGGGTSYVRFVPQWAGAVFFRFRLTATALLILRSAAVGHDTLRLWEAEASDGRAGEVQTGTPAAGRSTQLAAGDTNSIEMRNMQRRPTVREDDENAADTPLTADVNTRTNNNNDFKTFLKFSLGHRPTRGAQDAMHIFSAIVVLLVATKLSAIQLPPTIAMPAWFMVTNWMAVQIVLLLSSTEPDATGNTVQLLRTKVLQLGALLSSESDTLREGEVLEDSVLRNMLVAVQFTPSWCLVLLELFGTRAEAHRIVFLVVAFLGTNAGSLSMLREFLYSRNWWGPFPRSLRNGLLLALLPVISWVFEVGLHVSLVPEIGQRDDGGEPQHMFWRWLVEASILLWNASAASWTFAVSPMDTWRRTVGLRGWSRRWWPWFALVSGLVATGLYVVGVVGMYRAEDSYKPDWISWLP
jgi:hypothetical protein